MDVSTLEIAIIAIVVMGAVILIVYLMKHQMRRCRWCVRSTTPVGLMPRGDGEEVRRLIREEGMDPAVSYELCEACRRIYDEWWFKADWDMCDRWCACGFELSFPWDVDPRKLRKAVADLPPAVFTLLSKQYTPDDIAQLRRGYDDLDYRFERSPEAHALKVCGICHRIYMWIEIKGYQVFQCVSSGRDKYERVTDRRQMET